jgi:hypothetical protein
MFNICDALAYFGNLAYSLRDALKSCFDKYRDWMIYVPPKDDP